jgi:hypothetical protein
MAEINIIKMSEASFKVSIVTRSSTTHIVTVRPDYALKLTHGTITTEQLLRKSFEFLLLRESNTSILRVFDLSVIARYFPEYEREISRD